MPPISAHRLASTRNAALLLLVTSLTLGCGGGSSNSSNPTTAAVVTYPSSGIYAWAMPATGSLSAPTMGLTFIHPSDTSIRYVIEPATAAISDTKVVNSGTVSVANQTVSNIQPDSLLYIVGGAVKRVPLNANGAAPASRVKTTGNINACQFQIDANSFSNPDLSSFMVTTKGTDGLCGTVDDGQAIIDLSASGGISGTAWAYGTALGILHEGASLTPQGWVSGTSVYWRAPTSQVQYVMRTNAMQPITKVVAGNYKAIVAEYSNKLTMWKVTGTQTVTETVLDPVITAGTGWESIGYDATSFYLYRNSVPLASCTTASTWSVIKVNIATPAAAQVSTGAGCIASASMGTNLLYVSVLGATANNLLGLNKATGATQIVQAANTTDLISVLTSASGIHEMWLALNLSTNPSYAIKMIDETGATLKLVAPGVPMAVQDPASIDMNLSENRNRFIYSNGYTTSLAFGNSTIEAYDAAQQTTTALGSITGFGSTPAFVNVINASTDFTGGIAIPYSSGVLNEPFTKLFSVNTTTANSLVSTTTAK